MTISLNLKSGVLRSNIRRLPTTLKNSDGTKRRIRLLGQKNPEEICENRGICYMRIACDPFEKCVFTVGCD